MTEKHVDLAKSVSHLILMFLCIALSINLFIQFSHDLLIKLLFALFASALEVVKIWTLMKAKFHFSEKLLKKILIGVAHFTIYLGLAVVSILASLGFTLSSIQQQSFIISTHNIERDALNNDLFAIEKQIQSKLDQQANLPYDYITASDRFTQQIKDLQDQRQQIIDKINALPDNTQAIKSSDMFTLLGEPLGISGKSVMFYMMLLLVILLEFTIAITSEDIKRTKEKLPQLVDEREDLYRYIEELFNTSSAILNTDNRISEATGLSVKSCKKFRSILSDLTYKGTPLIVSGRDATKANFSKENTIKIVSFFVGENHAAFLH